MTTPEGQQPGQGAQPNYQQYQQQYSPQQQYQQPYQQPQQYYQQEQPYAGTTYQQQPSRPPAAPVSGERPGAVIGAVVVGFVQAIVTQITTGSLFLGLASSSSRELNAVLDIAELWVVAIVQLAGLALLIFGAVRLLSGTSRNLYLAGVGLQLALCVYWIIRLLVAFSDVPDGAASSALTGTSIVGPLVFAVLPAIGGVLALGGECTRYVAARRTPQIG